MQSRSLFIVLAVIVVLGVGGYAGYKVWHHYYAKSLPTMTPAPSQQMNQPSPSATNAGGLSNTTDTSNQQLNKDSQDIQNSMNKLQQDQNTTIQDSNNSSLDVPQQ